MTRYRSACVTGGAGFIGSHLVRRLLRRGIQVRVLDDLSVGRCANVPQEAHLVVGNVLDKTTVDECLKGVDIVFHLAARVAIRSSQQFVRQDAEANVVGTATIVDAAATSSSVSKFILASSMAVYSDSTATDLVSETHATEPISVYGVSKLAAEKLTHIVGRQAGLQTAALRLFNTYGPGQALSPYVGVVTIFAEKLRLGETPTIYGDGMQRRDFVHVEDVADAFERAMDCDLEGGASINVGTGRAVTVNDVLTALNRCLGTRVHASHVDPVDGELRNSVADISRARRVLGFAPRHAFETSIGTVAQQLWGTAAVGERAR